MKVKLVRKSMNPVEEYKLTEMMNEYKKRYDLLLKEHGTDMKSMHENLEILIEQLAEDYKDDLYVLVELPKSVKRWKELINLYDCTITLGTSIDTGELLLIMMDDEDTGISF